MFRSLLSTVALATAVVAAPATLRQRQGASVPDFVLKYGKLSFSLPPLPYTEPMVGIEVFNFARGFVA